jgi:hypothetical protein
LAPSSYYLPFLPIIGIPWSYLLCSNINYIIWFCCPLEEWKTHIVVVVKKNNVCLRCL